MKALLFASLLLLPIASLADEPVVVRNFDKPAGGYDIAVNENLRIGGANQKDIVFGDMVRLACDSKGQIIVADYKKNEIRKFGADGTLIGPIGRGGDGPGEYRFVVAIGIDAADNLYVVGAHRVRVYDASDKFVSDFNDVSLGLTRGLRALPDGGLLLAEYDRPTRTVLQKYVKQKNAVHFCDAFKFAGQYADEITMAYAGGFIDVGPDGMIYYTQTTPYEIRKFTPAGELVMQVFRENDFVAEPHIEKKGGATTFHPTSGATGIFVLPDGLFVNVVAIVGDDGKPTGTVLDLFDAEGHLLLSQRRNKYYAPQWCDRSGKPYALDLYAFDAEDLAVTRSRVSVAIVDH